MQELESEMLNPTGLYTVKPPKLEADVVLLSKDCGILFQVKETEGLR